MMAPTHFPPCRAAGFTLVELIVTMMVAGILAVAVLPRMDLLSGFDGIGYRDRVKATLEYARKSAVAQRRNVRVTLAAGSVTVDIASGAPEGGAAATFDRGLVLPGGNSNQVLAPGSITLAPAAVLVFSPLGRPSAGGVFSVSGGGGSITVEAESGYVH